MRTTTSKTVLASATGALALSLLLAGCSSSGPSDDPTDTSAGTDSGSSSESSPTASTAPEKTGTVSLPASCEQAGAALGELVAGLTLDAVSSVEGTEANCSWSDGADPATSVQRVLLLLETEPLDDAEADDLASSTLPGGTVVEADDERVDSFDGRAFLVDFDGAPIGQQGLGSAAFIAAPQGAVAVAQLRKDGSAPVATELVLDTALEFVD